MAHVKRLLRDERGQSLAEFALVLPVLLLIVFGIVEFALAWREYQIVTNVAREGARISVVYDPNVDADSVRRAVENMLNGAGLNASKATITVGMCAAYSCEGLPDTVKVEYPYDFPVLGNLAGFGAITLSSTTVMRHE